MSLWQGHVNLISLLDWSSKTNYESHCEKVMNLMSNESSFHEKSPFPAVFHHQNFLFQVFVLKNQNFGLRWFTNCLLPLHI